MCMVEELPFSQETMDLTFGKRLFYFFLFAEKWRSLFHICFLTIKIITQTVFGTVIFYFYFSFSIQLEK